MSGNPTRKQAESVELLYSAEAEKAVLGCYIEHARDCGDEIEATLVKHDFFLPAHQLLFGVVSELRAAGQAIDLLTVHQRLLDLRSAEQVGSPGVLAEINNAFSTHLNIASYVKVVKEKSVLRQLVSFCSSMLVEAQSGTALPKVLEKAEQSLGEVLRASAGRESGQFLTAKEANDRYFAAREQIQKGDRVVRYPTGFPGFDQTFSGLPLNGFTTVAARPGEGKTAFALNLLSNFCSGLEGATQRKTGLISLEMPCEELMDRIYAYEAKIDARRLQKRLTPREEKDLALVRDFVESWPMIIRECDSLNVVQLKTTLQELARLGCRVVIIDYLQLLTGDAELKRYEQIAELTRTIKLAAKQYGLCVVLLCQVNRESVKAGDEVGLHHLKDSGSIEQDAECCLFLIRTGESVTGQRTPFRIKVAKNRGGARGEVPMYYDGPWLRFSDSPMRVNS